MTHEEGSSLSDGFAHTAADGSGEVGSGAAAAPSGTVAGLDREQVLQDIIVALAVIVGEEVIEALEVNEETALSGDLELESIEFVVLAEKIQQKYGDAVDFISWSAKLELDELMDLTVGQVVEFVLSATRA